MNSLISFFFLSLFASAPESSYLEKVKEIKFDVKWSKTNAPKVISLNEKIYKLEELTTNKMSVKLSVYNQENLSIKVIPNSQELAPLVFSLPSKDKVIDLAKLSFSKIAPDEAWLWGITQDSHCHSGQVSHTIRSLYVSSYYKSVSGLFTWKLTKDEVVKYKTFNFLAGNTYNDLAKEISSVIFEKPSEKEKMRCLRYYGGECPHLKKLSIEKWQRSYEIKFEKTLKMIRQNCPV